MGKFVSCLGVDSINLNKCYRRHVGLQVCFELVFLLSQSLQYLFELVSLFSETSHCRQQFLHLLCSTSVGKEAISLGSDTVKLLSQLLILYENKKEKRKHHLGLQLIYLRN